MTPAANLESQEAKSIHDRRHTTLLLINLKEAFLKMRLYSFPGFFGILIRFSQQDHIIGISNQPGACCGITIGSTPLAIYFMQQYIGQ